MMARYSKLLGAAAAMLAPVIMSCHSAPTRVFTLDASAPTSALGSYGGPPIRIDAVHVPPALDRIEVVSNIAPGELKINDLDHWSAPLGQAARQALSADMVSRLPQGRVIFPHLAKSEDALGISVDVLDFKADQRGAYLEASWVITSTDPKSGAGRGTVALRTDLPSAGAASTAQALSALLAQLADRIVADLQSGCCGASNGPPGLNGGGSR
jgi:uncharacterized lipoprotein YmbA